MSKNYQPDRRYLQATEGYTASEVDTEISTEITTHNAVTTAHGISAFGATLVDDADAATARSTLGLGTAATTSSGDYATAAQGALADSSVQPGDNVSTLTNDSGYLTTVAFGDLTATPTTISGYGITDAYTQTEVDALTWDFDTDVTDKFYLPPTVRDEATDPYTLVIGDADKVLRFTTASAAVTIPQESSVNFPTGTEVSIRQAGTGTLVLTTTGLTINGTVPSWAQHVEVKFRKVGSDTWDVV